jgi:citrate synthase
VCAPPGHPSALYVGPGPRKPQDVEGWAEIPHGS